MTYPILNMAQILCAPQLDGAMAPRFIRSSRLPRFTDGPDVIAVIADGFNQPVARWVRNPNTRKLECSWSTAKSADNMREQI